jgi:hypothetical protein
MLLCLPGRLWTEYQGAIGTLQFVWLGCPAAVLNILEFADKVIVNNDESDGSGGKLRSSKVLKENNGGIGMGWAKEKGGGTTTTRTAVARRNNNGRGGKNAIGGGRGNESW